MANSAAVYARIEPGLKNEVEGILSQLGITPSAAVQMFYSQIKLTKSIPFEIKLPRNKPAFVENMSIEELNDELEKGYRSVRQGKTYSADEVDALFHEEFGI